MSGLLPNCLSTPCPCVHVRVRATVAKFSQVRRCEVQRISLRRINLCARAGLATLSRAPWRACWCCRGSVADTQSARRNFSTIEPPRLRPLRSFGAARDALIEPTMPNSTARQSGQRRSGTPDHHREAGGRRGAAPSVKGQPRSLRHGAAHVRNSDAVALTGLGDLAIRAGGEQSTHA